MQRCSTLFIKHPVTLTAHLDAKTPVCKPPLQWWLILSLVKMLSTRAVITFRSLQGTTTLVTEQMAQMKKLFSDIQIVFGVRAMGDVDNTGDADHIFEQPYGPVQSGGDYPGLKDSYYGSSAAIRKVEETPLVANYKAKLHAIYSNPQQLMFIDETSKDGRHAYRRYGWSARNTKCIVKLPFSRGKRRSIFAAVDHTGFVAWVTTEGTYSTWSHTNATLRSLLLRQVPFWSRYHVPQFNLHADGPRTERYQLESLLKIRSRTSYLQWPRRFLK
ncbi:hypothetical protein AM587_10003264 [Phytophthora nicotianae]|uniref:Uncharacterized protein n=1 Tax=Phytophthora nicotianae TaxID=4792 RepID=A0A0W8DPL3_PHYNI|nr:hypothetical protein AM587_10003264 [Phytophthora nicotianae]